MVSFDLDLYIATAGELQHLLSRGIVTSVDLVNWYLDQIDRHNHRGLELHAVVATTPRSLALDDAERLDSERAEGRLRSAAHGIPILVKVCRGTMHTYWKDESNMRTYLSLFPFVRIICALRFSDYLLRRGRWHLKAWFQTPMRTS
jgi:hypothetical protein